jgi:mRNA interferase HicA
MKRTALIKHIQKYGCSLLREGARHAVYYNPNNGRTTAVPRHNDIVDVLARKICRDLGIPEI